MPAALALLLAAASLGLAQSEPHVSESQTGSEPETALPSVSRVCVENHGGFQLSFALWDTVSNQVSERSDSYASGGWACLDLATLSDFEPGHPVVAVVHADGGITRSVRVPLVLYSVDAGGEGATASFTCSGSSGAFSCGLAGERRSDQPGAHVVPGEPASRPLVSKGICVQNTGAFVLRFRLWDTATGALSTWSEGITAPAGVGTPVCVDGSSVEGILGGHPLVPIVSPQGTTPGSFHSVVYDETATQSALFLCAGSNIWYDCKLLGSTTRRLETESEPHANESQKGSEPETALPSVSRVCVENHGGFQLSFALWDTVSNQVSERSDSYASGGWACLDLATLSDFEP